MSRYKQVVTDLEKLRDRCDEAVLQDEEKLNKTIKWLKDLLYSQDNLFALSAPQIGVNSRIFCMKFANGDIRTFINPMVTHTEGMHLSREKCSTLSDKEYIIPRYNEIEVTYQTPIGKVESNLFKETPSEVFQQMLHLLDGILLPDLGLEVLDGWDEATEEERQQVINLYLDSLQQENKELQDEIENNEELKQMSNAIKFMTGLATGEIKTEQVQPKLNREMRRKLAKLNKNK